MNPVPPMSTGLERDLRDDVRRLAALADAYQPAAAESAALDAFAGGGFGGDVSFVSRPRVFVAGAGRSGFAARAFAMRLAQAGWTVHLPGDATTPALATGDVLVLFSGSAATASLVAFAATARRVGARTLLVTRAVDGPLVRDAHWVVRLPTEAARDIGEDTPGPHAASSFGGDARRNADADANAAVPSHGAGEPGLLGGLFEMGAWLWGDAFVRALMRRCGIVPDDLRRRHANLE